MARKISDDLLDALLFQESGGDPNAVNERTGASGIAQIMADTARDPGFGVKPISLKDRFNPEKAIPFARSFMNAMLEKFDGNVANALAAYNFGPGNVDKWLRSGASFDGLPDETRNYVVNVLGNRGNAPPLSTQPEVRGSLQREGDVDLSGLSQDDLDDAAKIQDRIEARRLARERKAQVEANNRSARLQRAARRNRPGVQARPNLRPAPSGGGGSRLPVKAFQTPAITAPAVDPLATNQSFIQGLLNPATSGGLLGARNLGPTGLLSPALRR